MAGSNRRPRKGAGGFLLSSPDIKTFSTTGVVILMAVLGALILIDLVISTWCSSNVVAAAMAGGLGFSCRGRVGYSAPCTNPRGRSRTISVYKHSVSHDGNIQCHNDDSPGFEPGTPSI